MKRTSLLLVFMFACLVGVPALGKTHAEFNGRALQEKRMDKVFNLNGDGNQKLKVTLSCSETGSGSGRMRVYFHQRSPQGGWDQIDHLRVMIQGDQAEKSDTFVLPPGEYKVTVTASKLKYSFKLEDAN